ncbi:membrane protein involved in aromatic hydrocarbon degradation [Candidatus Vecturithrix granuli]|uniref:Membrane protein involved in aromatic hydrocarbon degradation n=1 Tax=Vecturithrix granuli TaxID=1499967 RepID=A0A081C0P2_VECG1|nr:membrane protein involved in aromatic hydrocarbon degradation [Candidatus Vecturithrix granuli]
MVRYGKIFALTMVLVLCEQMFVFALTDEEIFSQFQFNFLTPGARATALGGAFIGLADDATAVESNPAGLTQLYDPEVSLEFKYISYTTEQIFENFYAVTDIKTREFDNSVQGLPFMSVAFPYKRMVFSFYRQELVNYESSYRTSQYPIRIPDSTFYFYPIDGATDLTVTNYGIGVAIQPVEGLSIAVSPRWSELDMEASVKRFDATLEYDALYGYIPTDFSDTHIKNKTWIDDSDAEFSINAGVMWRLNFLEKILDIPRISLGAVYRTGPRFEVTESFSYRLLPTYVNNQYEVITDVGKLSDMTAFTLKVPDSYGFGLAVQPTNALTFTVDIVCIEYQDLLKDFDIVLDSNEDKNDYTVDNAVEAHVGAEYVLTLGERLLALRLGGYYEPDHTIRYTGDDATNKILFPGGDDQLHFTGGVGLVINEHFQIDTAANIAENNKQFSISTVYRF